jgi:NADPH2:quinone reductase
LVVGFAAGEIPAVPLNLALLKGCSIIGVFWGAFTVGNLLRYMFCRTRYKRTFGQARESATNAANIEVLCDWQRTGKIKPLVSKTYPLRDAAQALEDMLARKVIFILFFCLQLPLNPM